MALSQNTCAGPRCSKPIEGSLRRYHSNACRQAAYRARRALALSTMTRDLFEEVMDDHGTDEQRAAYRELLDRFGPEFARVNGAVLFDSALPRDEQGARP